LFDALRYPQLYKEFFILTVFYTISALPEELSRTFNTVKDVDVDISEINDGIYIEYLASFQDFKLLLTSS
jgi:hypothetical protein